MSFFKIPDACSNTITRRNLAGLTISLGPFLEVFLTKINLNIITDIIDVEPVVLGNTNNNFFRFFQILLLGYIKSSQTMVVHDFLWC